MVGMLQILTYLFSFYLVVKGLEFIQRAMVAPTETRGRAGVLAAVVLAASVGAAYLGITHQDEQALSVSRATSSFSPY